MRRELCYKQENLVSSSNFAHKRRVMKGALTSNKRCFRMHLPLTARFDDLTQIAKCTLARREKRKKQSCRMLPRFGSVRHASSELNVRDSFKCIGQMRMKAACMSTVFHIKLSLSKRNANNDCESVFGCSGDDAFSIKSISSIRSCSFPYPMVNFICANSNDVVAFASSQ